MIFIHCNYLINNFFFTYVHFNNFSLKNLNMIGVYWDFMTYSCTYPTYFYEKQQLYTFMNWKLTRIIIFVSIKVHGYSNIILL